MLHPRVKGAATADALRDAETVDVLEGGAGNVVRLQQGGWFRFDMMNLAGITHLTFRLAPLAFGSFDSDLSCKTTT